MTTAAEAIRPKPDTTVPCPYCWASSGGNTPLAILWGRPEDDPCPQCHGTSLVTRCPTCKGLGSFPMDEPEEKQRILPRQEDCSACEGTGIVAPVDIDGTGVPHDLWWLLKSDPFHRFVVPWALSQVTPSQALYLWARAVRVGVARPALADAFAVGWREHRGAEAEAAGVAA